MIEVLGLTKRYGPVLAVDDLSFTVRPACVTGFVGPNGAGKSTTLRMILGLAKPDRGRALIDGQRYVDLPAPMRAVGALLDASDAYPARTAYHHLLCLAQSNGLVRCRVDEVLAAAGLTSVAGRRVGGFSLGMRQRLGLAAALLGDPPVLILDEPSNGLDPEGIVWIRQLLKGLAAEGRTVLVSSHLMGEMALAADHLIVLGRGRLIADTPVEAFVNWVAPRSVRVRAEQAGFAGRLGEAGATVAAEPDGALRVTKLDSAAIGRLAAAEGVVLTELTPQRRSLEEAFMDVTQASTEYRAS